MGALVELLSYFTNKTGVFYYIPCLITKDELGYDKAGLWYSFPLDALTPGSVWGATATGSILTTFMIEGKKTRQHLKSEPKGP